LEVVVDQVYIFTNGLMLPLLSFIDHVSSNIGTIVPCYLLPVDHNNVDLITTKVYAYLRSAAFNKTDIWIRVSERFTSVVHSHKRAIIEYLSFRLTVDSQTELEHFGCLIGNEMPPILSAFAINNIFKQPVESSSASPDDQVEPSLQNCILSGLRTMTLDDFEEPTSAVNFRYENAIGFRWLTHLSRNIPHVYVSPQTQVIREEHLLRRGANPTVDILLNGIMDCALELARCGATRGGNRQKYLNEKALKCLTGPYRHWGNHGIFVIEFNNQDPVLPELNIVDEVTGETVCTAALQEKVFTFVFPTNTLYRGNKIVKRGAVNHLPSATTKNSSLNSPAAFTVEESSSSSTSEDDGDRDGDKSGEEEAEDPSPLKKDLKSKDDDGDGLLGASGAVSQPRGKVTASKKRGATSASAVNDDAAENEAVSKKKVPRRRKK
jgi:hypothetical protein